MDLETVHGDAGELVDRLMALLGLDPPEQELWWFDYGSMVAYCIGGDTLLDMRETEAMGAAEYLPIVRERIDELLAENVDEAFLVRSLRRYLDDFVDKHGDTGQWDESADSFVAFIQRAIDDSEARERYRAGMARRSERFANITDDELIADLRRTLERHPMAKKVSAEDAAERWARVERWRAASVSFLSDETIDLWANRRVGRR